MTRRMMCAAGAVLLAGLNGWASPAFSQGPMAPRMDVAPPPRVAPPPPPPVFVPPVVPTPPPMPVAPVMAPPPPPPPAPKAPTATAPATPTPATPAPVATPTPTPTPPPATGSPQTPRATASAPSPYTDSQVRALRGVGVGLRGPGGNRQLTSDSNGVVSLGKLGPGRHELTVNRKSLGTGTGTAPLPGGQPVALIGLLLPAVQGVRYASTNVPPVNDPDEQVQIKVEVDAGGRVSRIDWGGGKASINVAVGDFTGDGRTDLKHFDDLAKRNTSGETRLVFVTPVPGSNAAALADANAAMDAVSTTRLGTTPGNPTGPDKPIPNNSNAPIPGIDVVVQKKPSGGKAISTSKTDGTGQTTFRQLEPGNYEVALPSVPGGGSVSMTTFVNGKESSRTDFPVGSSVGTFSVGNARDTITLKFERIPGPAPANRTAGTPTGPGTPIPNYSNNPIPGIDVVVQKKPSGTALTQNTGGDGTTTLGVLTPGTHSVVLDTKKLLDARIPGPSGSEPAQPAGILLGLLLPAVQ
ncbi:carboxypeptidase-like regulatory domain-containing protein, partial [Reyranella sp.]|uniref:carboxypeptidase-like regulatory domain-containing protein n=1 Tax=Reyranella sp. TaxID=1929291 RepID=UPI00271BBE72